MKKPVRRVEPPLRNPPTDRRGGPAWRRDLNAIARDESGGLSPAKIGGIAGQIIAGNYLLTHWEIAITSWDILSILFTVLIAPELLKKLLAMKYGWQENGKDKVVTSTATAETVTTTKGKTRTRNDADG